MISLLLEANSSVNQRNNNGWSSLVEAISYGSRDTSNQICLANDLFLVMEMLKASRRQAGAALSARKPHLLKMLNELRDFYIEFKWVFQSWSAFFSFNLNPSI